MATPCLYRDLDIPYDEDDPRWLRLKSLASSKGLQYAQSLKFGSCNFTKLGFCHELDGLVPKLRQDSLRRFEFGRVGQPTHETMKYLWNTQRCLRNLQLNFDLLSPSIDDILGEDAPLLKLLQSVDELDVNFAATVNADSAHKLLTSLVLGKLRNIKITVYPSDDPREAPLGGGFFIQHFPATLTHITLNYIVLPAPECLQLDSYPGLVYLNLHDCQNTGPVLDAFRSPVLRELSYCHGSRDPPPGELISMLGRFHSLVKLVLDVDWRIGFHNYDVLTTRILVHKRTLKSLLLWGIGLRHRETLRLFLEMVPMCTQLRQLALEFETATVLDECKVDLQHLFRVIAPAV